MFWSQHFRKFLGVSLLFLTKNKKTTILFSLRSLSLDKKNYHLSSSLSFSSLISAFLELRTLVVSTHPQSSTVAPLVHSRASPSCLCSSICRALLQTATVSPSFVTPELSSIAESVTKQQHDSTCSKSSFSGASCFTIGISVLFSSRRHWNQSGEEQQWRFDKRFGFFKTFSCREVQSLRCLVFENRFMVLVVFQL